MQQSDRQNSATDASQLYGPTWAGDMRALSLALQNDLGEIVECVHSYLAERSGLPAPDVASGTGFGQVEVYHANSLSALIGPALTEQAHRRLALATGLRHTMMRLDRASLIRGNNFLYAEFRNRVDTAVHERALAVLGRRLVRDLGWQTQAYATQQMARNDIVLRLTHLAWEADSYTDLINRAASILHELDGVDGCAFGRPDQDGFIRYEAIAGDDDFKQHLAAANALQQASCINEPDNGLASRAWHTGQIMQSPNIADDARIPQPWKELLNQAGLQSAATIPLGRPGHTPRAVLNIYGRLRRGPAGPAQANLIIQVQMLLAFAINRLESQHGQTRLAPYLQRQRWTSLLRSNALEMHYQPLLDLRTREIRKVEALARLRDGDRLLAPGMFFPALTSDDFVDLYSLGLKQVLAQRNNWLESTGMDLHVSINMPSSALADTRYFQATRRALDESGCAPHKLSLEILETEEIPRHMDVADELEHFKALGVRLAEDDLGSGYSSLSRLRELPFDTIKIDRSIVMNVHQDSSNVLRFIYQLTRLGHSLGKDVVVEGVETTDLLEAIVILGADVAQGWVVARPMPADEIPRWIQSRALPDLPEPGRAHSLLARLARLVIWEERLQLILSDRPSAGSSGEPSRLYADPLEALNHASTLSASQDGTALSLPLDDADPQAQQALVMAAVNHGLYGREYAQARQVLVQTLQARDPGQ
ncbi:EAL domain-containing protein [Bordetella sp. FB-8]|uniref:EAL domain-containing protein n=1 Tax=Bordetella sp. FB-8 TaxID=1159870 RepID=UPI00038240E3|nr:EAL domain-containing protein [Bordetella sp. FB-8]